MAIFIKIATIRILIKAFGSVSKATKGDDMSKHPDDYYLTRQEIDDLRAEAKHAAKYMKALFPQLKVDQLCMLKTILYYLRNSMVPQL